MICKSIIKRFKTIVILAFILTLPAFSKDFVIAGDILHEGKIDSASSDYILLKKEGNFVRFLKEDSLNQDFILFRPTIFSRKSVGISGIVYYLDSKKVKISTNSGLVTIPRYKVNEITIYAK